MASRAMDKQTPSGNGAFVVSSIKATRDGSISNPRLEIFAILLADRVPQNQAWIAAADVGSGKEVKNGGSAGNYKRNVLHHPIFKGRLSLLETERDEMEKDDAFGDVIWATRQVYRMCVAKGDTKGMMDASKQLFEIAKLRKDMDKPAEPTETRGPGRPSVQRPGGAPNISKIVRDLEEKGLKTDKTDDILASETAGNA